MGWITVNDLSYRVTRIIVCKPSIQNRGRNWTLRFVLGFGFLWTRKQATRRIESKKSLYLNIQGPPGPRGKSLVWVLRDAPGAPARSQSGRPVQRAVHVHRLRPLTKLARKSFKKPSSRIQGYREVYENSPALADGAPSLNWSLMENCVQVPPPAAPSVDNHRLLHAPCWRNQATSHPEPWTPTVCLETKIRKVQIKKN